MASSLGCAGLTALVCLRQRTVQQIVDVQEQVRRWLDWSLASLLLWSCFCFCLVLGNAF